MGLVSYKKNYKNFRNFVLTVYIHGVCVCDAISLVVELIRILSVGRTIRGELSVGRTVRGASCRGVSFDGASFDGASFDGASCPGTTKCTFYSKTSDIFAWHFTA
jgi:hypothetical protein